MKEIDLDIWFFDLPACWQMVITAIYMDEDTATDADYERFDNTVADWWDSQDYETKLEIYEHESLAR